MATETPRQAALLVSIVSAALLAGCSSDGGSEPGPTTASSSAAESSTRPTGTATTKRKQDDGGFDTAGRISGDFTGNGGHVHFSLHNPSTTETYTGTVNLTDCTAGKGRWPTVSPKSLPVNLRPGATDEFDVDFTPDETAPFVSQHTICAHLTGRSEPWTFSTTASPPSRSPSPSASRSPSQSSPES
ncbi:hypothetical protein F4556_006984 [Kitasatospora gansuensis]|uniref:Uncharacterized protein n=1 Tax=Kitasatospora gansuensis TaxID=258050 RepID=A0A7W7WM59_9ACTN|nr:hypothetical protein [Kitasatospora gansuensis]MBB4951449.1 hypothetical protein [Kitasatospora gansuensis]